MSELVGQKVNLKVSSDLYKSRSGEMIECKFYSIDDPVMAEKLRGMRVHLPSGDGSTCDFVPFRQNAEIDESGTITRVWLG